MAQEINFHTPLLDTIFISVADKNTGCANLIAIPVRMAEKPVPYFTEEVFNGTYTIKFQNETEQAPLTNADTLIAVPVDFYWHFGLENDNTRYFQPYVTVDEETGDSTYYYDTKMSQKYPYGDFPVTLTAINSHGCKDSITINVHMEINTAFYLPTAFAPDHKAEYVKTFRPSGFNLESYEMTIYDSWGNIIWYTDALNEDGQPAEAWDGRDRNGNMLPADNYIWKAKVKFRNGQEWEGRKHRHHGSAHWGSRPCPPRLGPGRTMPPGANRLPRPLFSR